jgi:hypothetical protein
LKQSAGIDRAYIRSTILPPWWDDEIARNPAGYAEAKIRIARGLKLDPRSIEDSAEPIRFAECGNTKFKRVAGVSEDDLCASKTIAWRALELACKATPTGDSARTNKSALSIRQEILDTGKPYVDLANLLDWCWDSGITALHVGAFPKAVKKMDGLAARIDGRGGIVVSRNQRFSSWLLFILAHELGHVVLNHVANDEVRVDEKVDPKDEHNEEAAANVFAIEVLTGQPDIEFESAGRVYASEFARRCKDIGPKHFIEPGALALMYAKKMNDWQLGMAALKLLEPEADAAALVNKSALDHLDEERIGEENFDLLCRLMAVERQD